DPVSPWLGAAYVTTSRRSHTFSAPALAAVPRRWPRSSAWSPTTSHETNTGNGVCVSWKMVPAVTEVWYPHPPHSYRLRTAHIARQVSNRCRQFASHRVTSEDHRRSKGGK